MSILGKLTDKEFLLYIAKTAALTICIAWLFYDSVLGLIVGFIWVPVSYKQYKKERRERELFELEKQFQDGISFAAGALEAGYSVENAFVEAEKETVRLYGKEGVFSAILHNINKMVHMNAPLEKLVVEFGQNTESENIKSFAEVFFFARKSGGNMPEIMKVTSERLRQNFGVKDAIRLSIASKQLEQKVMSIMPLGIMAYLRIGSEGFLDPIYHTSLGVAVMTGCLGIYGVSYMLAKKIADIKI